MTEIASKIGNIKLVTLNKRKLNDKENIIYNYNSLSSIGQKLLPTLDSISAPNVGRLR
jgi:hypothetical protein